jgi:hypothetical protein
VTIDFAGHPIGLVTFQGVGTWDAGALTIVRLLRVPQGVYTVTITGEPTGEPRQNFRVDCNDRNVILYRP